MLVNKERGVQDANKHWSGAQKLEAVKTFLVTGNVAMTARMLKVPEQTMFHWARSPWWQEHLAELKLQDDLQLSGRLKRILDKTLDVVEDRLEHGDFVYDQKSGQMRRKPVNARDAAKIGIDFDNKRETVLSRAGVQTSEEAIDDKLTKLAQKFADIVNKRDTSGAIDVEVKETTVAQDDGLPDLVYSNLGEDSPGDFLQEEESGLPGH